MVEIVSMKWYLFYVFFFYMFSPLIESEEKIYKMDYKKCGLNNKARALAKLIINDLRQNRTLLKCNSKLSIIAEKKAIEMSKLGRVSHIGKSPANRRLINEGYALSKIYPSLFENNVEAVAGGISDPSEVWIEFKESRAHRIHLLAEHKFYLLQNEIGVGFYSDKKTAHVEYWVVYIAHQREKEIYRGSIAESKN
ncbi:MAG: hypothetical protein COA86_11035 [Kangiella sp.]|nr:MAG: hypothetical protein COA86_11035 [Kangiella sp.]